MGISKRCVNRLRCSYAIPAVGRILLVHGQPLAVGAVGPDEDGVAQHELAVPGAVGLRGADVAKGFVIDTMVDRDVEVSAFRYRATGQYGHVNIRVRGG